MIKIIQKINDFTTRNSLFRFEPNTEFKFYTYLHPNQYGVMCKSFKMNVFHRDLYLGVTTYG